MAAPGGAVPPGQVGDRRLALLRAHRAAHQVYAESLRQASTKSHGSPGRDEVFWHSEFLRAEYLGMLPEVDVSRCPHTGQVLTVLMDTADIDGLWWDYFLPLRLTGPRPPTLLAMTGAMRLGAPLPYTEFLVKPGPAVPHVLKDLLVNADVTAVVSTVRIGPHTGYVMAYFAADPERCPGRANEWGASGFTRISPDGSLEWGAVDVGLDNADFDLAPYLDSGSLQWIEPDDETLTLRAGATSCPYIGLPGDRRQQRIEGGALR